jgi:hypothetical protein
MTSFQEKQNIVILIFAVGHNTPNNKQETCNMFLRLQLQCFVTLIENIKPCVKGWEPIGILFSTSNVVLRTNTMQQDGNSNQCPELYWHSSKSCDN